MIKLLLFFLILNKEKLIFVKITELIGDSKRVNAVSFTPDGSYVVAGGEDGVIKVWESEKFNQIALLKAHPGGINTLSFSPNGRFLSSGGNDSGIKLWRTIDWKVEKTFKSEDKVTAVLFVDTSCLITGSAKGEVVVWNILSKERKTLTRHRGIVSLSSNQGIVATGGSDRLIKIWEPTTFREITTLKGFKDFIGATSISPDGKLIAIGVRKSIEIWSLENFSKGKTLKPRGPVISGVKFSPKGNLLFASDEPCFGGSGYIRVWSRDGWLLLGEKEFPGGVISFDFSPTKKLLAVASEKKVIIFKLREE